MKYGIQNAQSIKALGADGDRTAHGRTFERVTIIPGTARVQIAYNWGEDDQRDGQVAEKGQEYMDVAIHDFLIYKRKAADASRSERL